MMNGIQMISREINLFLLFQVWDVMSNKEAVKIVSSAPDRATSAKRLVECAAQEWKRKKPGCAVDDISAICLFLDSTRSIAADYSSKAMREVGP